MMGIGQNSAASGTIEARPLAAQEQHMSELIPPAMITPHPRNVAIYGDEDVTELAERIKASNWIKPLVVTPGNVIISGHRRWRAAMLLNAAMVPVERRAFASETEELEALLLENASRDKTTVQRTREAEVWREIERARARLRQLAAQNNDTAKSVPVNLPELGQKGDTRDKVADKIGMSGSTYERASKVVATADELAANGEKEEAERLLALCNKSVNAAHKEMKRRQQQQQATQVEAAMDGVLPFQERIPAPVVQPGEWWRLGEHMLYCGDTSAPEFITRLPQAAFAFADPPYNAGVDVWDTEFIWNHDYLIASARRVVVTPGIASLFDFARRTTMPYRWAIACWIDNGMTRGALGFGNWIYAALFSHERIHINDQDFVRTSIDVSATDKTQHRGRKPAGLLVWLLNRFTQPGEIVIDPFLGSGTTLLAAETTGRRCVGGEIDPEYCAAIIGRWQVATGGQAWRQD